MMFMQALWGISSGKGSLGESKERVVVGKTSVYLSPYELYIKGIITPTRPFSCHSTLFFLSDGDALW